MASDYAHPSPAEEPAPLWISHQASYALTRREEDRGIVRDAIPEQWRDAFDECMRVQLIKGEGQQAELNQRTLVEKEKIQATRKARDLDRAERMQALDSGDLGETAKRHLAKLNEVALDDLSGIPDPIPVIEGLLYQETVNYLAGASGAYKTIVALDIAARVQNGHSFCDMPVTKGSSLYIIAEGLSGMKHRQKAWEVKHNGGNPMGVQFIPIPVQFADLEAEMPALLTFAKEGKYNFIVFDTQAMCTLGIKENDADEWALVIDAAYRLARATQGCVLIVHHTGKDEANGLRGSSGMYANTNTVIAAMRKGSETEVTLSTARARGGKQKDAPEIEGMLFTIEALEGSIALDEGEIEQWRPEDRPIIYTPDITRRELIILEALIDTEAVGGLTATQIARVVEDKDPKNGPKPWAGNNAASWLDKLVRNNTVEKSGAHYLATQLGHDAANDSRDD